MTLRNETMCNIQLFGEMNIQPSGARLSRAYYKGTKQRRALAYLLLKRGKPAASEELMKIAGIDPESASAVGTLKVLICRIRRMLSNGSPGGPECIEKTLDGYAWNPSGSARVDLFEAESLCGSLLYARGLPDLSPGVISALVDLYAQELLPEFENEAWADIARWKFRNQRGDAMSHALKLMWKAGEADQVIRICHLGLANAPVDAMLWANLESAMKEMKLRGYGYSDAMTGLANTYRRNASIRQPASRKRVGGIER